jgi:hypothetical protein
LRRHRIGVLTDGAPLRHKLPAMPRQFSQIVFLNELLKQTEVGWCENYSVAYP